MIEWNEEDVTIAPPRGDGFSSRWRDITDLDLSVAVSEDSEGVSHDLQLQVRTAGGRPYELHNLKLIRQFLAAAESRVGHLPCVWVPDDRVVDPSRVIVRVHGFAQIARGNVPPEPVGPTDEGLHGPQTVSTLLDDPWKRSRERLLVLAAVVALYPVLRLMSQPIELWFGMLVLSAIFVVPLGVHAFLADVWRPHWRLSNAGSTFTAERQSFGRIVGTQVNWSDVSDIEYTPSTGESSFVVQISGGIPIAFHYGEAARMLPFFRGRTHLRYDWVPEGETAGRAVLEASRRYVRVRRSSAMRRLTSFS